MVKQLQKDVDLMLMPKQRTKRQCSYATNDISDVVFEAISHAFPGEGDKKDVKNRYIKILAPKKASFNPNIDGEFALSVPRDRSLHSYKSLFCRRCLIYDCHLHSAEMDLPLEELSKMVFRNHKEGKFVEHTPKENSPCSENCFMNHLKDDPSKVPLTSINKADESIILAEWYSSPGNFCFITKVIFKKSVTCHMVYLWCKKEIVDFRTVVQITSNGLHGDSVKLNGANNGNTGEFDDESNCSSSNSASSSNCQDIQQCRNNISKRKNLHGHGHKAYPAAKNRRKNPFIHIQELKAQEKEVHNYTPCIDHIGQDCSTSNCHCLKRGDFCEKYCLCSSKCQYRFPGCRCSSNCSTNQCPCFKASRECDPDLCKVCGAGDYPEPKKCSNVLLQRMKKKHLLIAPSDLGFDAGWGCFTKERINRNELISEYCGEVISQHEADRRGIIYDKYKISFLFQLNTEFAVDATIKGNKIRFANHSVNPNCFAKVCKVNGEHRIGIYAKRDIEEGEELFFDYKYGNNERLIFVPIEPVPVGGRESHGPKIHSIIKETNNQSKLNGKVRNTNGTSSAKNGRVSKVTQTEQSHKVDRTERMTAIKSASNRNSSTQRGKK